MSGKAAAVLGVAMALATAGCGGKAANGGSETAPSGGAGGKGMTEKTPYAVMTTTQGRIVIKLLPKAAPKTVANFIELAAGKKSWTDPSTGQPTQRPLYDGTVFHRVIPDFMIQGGDPLGTGRGGPGYQFEDEFSPSYSFSKPGLLAMANSGSNTNGSQFFITVAATPWLNNKHTIFGEVTEGQEVANAISKVAKAQDGFDKPVTPVVIQKLEIEYR